MKDDAKIFVSGDATGNLVGTVSRDNGKEPIVDQMIAIKGNTPLGGWTHHAVTDKNGFFVAKLPAYPTGQIDIAADNVQTSVNTRDLPLRLTLRPSDPHLRQSLCGKWSYKPDPKEPGSEWVNVTVPGHPEMEGHYAKTETGLYQRGFTVPETWKGKRVKLRAEAIYSSCEILVNGETVGSHDGGATPFEFDITDVVQYGKDNEIDVAIVGRSRAAEIDNMSTYACIEIAGIWRPIEIFCVEALHVARMTYQTTFDDKYRDAMLDVQVRVSNESNVKQTGALTVQVVGPDGNPLNLDGLKSNVEVHPWESTTVSLSVKVKNPLQWSAEMPNLYRLECSLDSHNQAKQIVEQPLGFRQVEIKGKGIHINGQPVKLFGACLHASDPYLGRAIGEDLVEKDLELMKGANLNAIRTSHYPPHPHTVAYADKIGLYIEDEGPSCWARNHDNLEYAPLYVGILSEMVERDRNNPSVVYWSTCNESDFGIIFQLAHWHIKSLDTTRPGSGTYAPLEADTDAYVIHHPTNLHEHIEITKDYDKPVFYDECLTVFHGWDDFAETLELDPGMHDYWETRMLEIRRQEMRHENQVGTMIWAWVDDAFLCPGRGIGISRRNLPQIRYTEPIYKLPNRGYVGDCVWGMIDSWRRPRPVWWHSKKVYSPVLIPEEPLSIPKSGQPIEVPVENLNWFANLSIYRCEWQIAGRRGTVVANVPPSSQGTLSIDAPCELNGDEVLQLDWWDQDKRLVDSYRLSFRNREAPEWNLGTPALMSEEDRRYLHEAKVIYMKGKDSELAYEKVSGELMWGLHLNEQVLSKAPRLHVLWSDSATTHDPGGWQFTEEEHEPGSILWKGRFGTDFEGEYRIQMDIDGNIEASYRFVYQGADRFAREIGLDFELPKEFDQLSWQRKSSHSVYPEDHIGRPHGVAPAHPQVDQVVPPTNRPYGLDDHPWGSNDFRSCKRNILLASLTNKAGRGIEVVSDGTQHVRATVADFNVHLKVLDFYGGSGRPDGWTVVAFHYGPGRKICQGDIVQGTARVRLL